MADVDLALNHVFRVEGDFVNHPSDPGGATRYGITQRTLDHYIGVHGEETFHVAKLTKHLARDIYREMYWDKLRLNVIDSQAMATLIFDQAVNQGLSPSTKRCQYVLNYCTRGEKLVQDGIMGPKTLNALNRAPLRTFMIEFIKNSQLYYMKIIRNRPEMSAFAVGWTKRTHKLLDIANYGDSF